MPKGIYIRTPEILTKWKNSRSWYKITDEQREKLKKAKKGCKRPDMLVNNPMFREEIRERVRQFYIKANPDAALYKENRKEYQRRYMKKNMVRVELYRSKEKEKYRKDRLICLTHYGGNPPKCKCCGELFLEFLAIDHINGQGNKLRKEKKYGSGGRLYFWLIKNNFPEGFQILCHNCNLAKGFYGYCPHNEI